MGPLTGGVVAGLLYDYVFSAGATVAKASKCLLRTKKPTQQPEKPPLGDGAAPEVIEIDEKEATVDEKEASAAATTDSDKAKLTEDSAKE